MNIRGMVRSLRDGWERNGVWRADADENILLILERERKPVCEVEAGEGSVVESFKYVC